MVKKQSDVKEFSISVFIPAIRINYQYAAVMEHMKGILCMCDGDRVRHDEIVFLCYSWFGQRTHILSSFNSNTKKTTTKNRREFK